MISEFYNLNLEITDYCNLKCPTCSRIKDYRLQEKKSLDEFPFVNKSNVSLQKYKNWFPNKTLQKIKSINFCGAYGEPLLNKDFLDIVSYTHECNSDIKMMVSTNASLNTNSFWSDLGKLSKKTGLLIFGHLDSLQEKNSLYRVGSNSKKIINNLDICISNGGNCHLNLIPFKHNENEIKQMKKLSEIMGFSGFNIIKTNGFEYYSSYSYINQEKKITLYPPSNQESYKINHEITDNQNVEKCYAEHTHMREICSRGIVSPCCWVQRKIRETYHEFYENGNIDCLPSHRYNTNILSKHFLNSFIDILNIKELSLDYFSFEEINSSEFYLSSLENSWDTNKFCKTFCSKNGRGRKVTE